MQMLNHQNKTNKIKKSHLLLFGSLLIFIGVISLSWNYFQEMRNDVFSNMMISMSNINGEESTVEVETPQVVTDNQTTYQETPKEMDYSKYLGVLEIPRISLKRGFYNTNSKYNTIEKNVTMVSGSTLPDVQNGNLILMAHSGDAYISYFAYLYRLNIGNNAYVTYNGVKYTYQIVNVYTVPKSGKVTINRNYNKTTLTLITCTKDSSDSQTVYIAELV